MVDDLDQAIRNMIADELIGPAIRERFGSPCTGLSRKIREGFDINPRTVAAIFIIRRLLEMQAGSPLDD